MPTKLLPKSTAPATTRAVAPDDLRPGDYIALTHATYQLVPLDDGPWQRELRPQTIRMIPCEAGEAHRVLAVCLPFVLTRAASGIDRTLDLRRHEVRRLDRAFGRQAFRAQDKRADDANRGKSKRKGKGKGKKRKRK